MTHAESLITYVEGNSTMQLFTRIVQLKKTGNTETLLTRCGKVINLNNLLCIDGIPL